MRSTTGYGFGIPYFWAISPNMDLTLTPKYYVRQGLWGDSDFRYRLDNGYFYLDVNGIHQTAASAFAQPALGRGRPDQPRLGHVPGNDLAQPGLEVRLGRDAPVRQMVSL